MRSKLSLIALLVVALAAAAYSQESVGAIQIRISLDRADWTYELGQPARFSTATTLNNSQVSGLSLKYSCGPEAMPAGIEKTVTTVAEQSIVVEAPGMKEPGFYRCIASFE